MSKPRRRPVFRDLDGILLLDKPAGLSSNQALQRVRHLLRAAKAGHTGALDPLATGLLPLCFGEATKIAGLLLGASKAYETVAALGITTDTLDADGAVLLTRPVPTLTAADVELALAPLRGRILQTPPVYSALKRDGEPLYARARRGEHVEVEAREVDVHRLELAELTADRIRLRIECGSGTYVRSLVRDVGEALGCGAHVVELRRTWVEPFRDPQMWTIDALQQQLQEDASDQAVAALLLPVDAGLTAFPALRLSAEQARRLGQGQGVPLEGTSALPLCVVQDSEGHALGMGEIDAAGQLRVRRLFRWAGVTGSL